MNLTREFKDLVLKDFNDTFQVRLEKENVDIDKVFCALNLKRQVLNEAQWVPITIQLLEKENADKLIGFKIIKQLVLCCTDKNIWLKRNLGAVLVDKLLPFITFSSTPDLVCGALDLLLLLYDSELSFVDTKRELHFAETVFRDMYFSTLVFSCGKQRGEFLVLLQYLPKFISRMSCMIIPYSSKILALLQDASEHYLSFCHSDKPFLADIYDCVAEILCLLAHCTNGYSVSQYLDINIVVLLLWSQKQPSLFKANTPKKLFKLIPRCKLESLIEFFKCVDDELFKDFIQCIM